MKRLNRLRLTILILGLFFGVAFYKTSLAAPGSISVAPAFATVQISSTVPEAEQVVSVKNNFPNPVRLSATPYGVDKQSGQISATEQPDPVMVKTISISNTDFTLQPNQSINLKLLVKNSDELAPGGHNAAILIKQIEETSGNVGFQQAVGVSLYIIKEDGAKRSLTLSLSPVRRLMLMIPNHSELTFKNTGNVVLVPRASVSIQTKTDIYGKGVANEDSLPISPGNELKLNTEIKKQKNAWIPAKYSLITQYRFDGDVETQVTAQTFWYVPWWMILAAILILIVLYWQRKRLIRIVRSIKIKPKKSKIEPEAKKSPANIIDDIKPLQK